MSPSPTGSETLQAEKTDSVAQAEHSPAQVSGQRPSVTHVRPPNEFKTKPSLFASSAVGNPSVRPKKPSKGLVVTDLLKLRIALDQSTDLTNACQVLAENLGNLFDCNNVFVSLWNKDQLSLLGIENSDSLSVSNDVILSAQRESTAELPDVGWPNSNAWRPSIVHKNLTDENHDSAVSFLIRDTDKSPFGVVTIVADIATCSAAAEKIQHVASLVIPHLRLQQTASLSLWERTKKSCQFRFSKHLNWMLACCLLLAVFFVRIPQTIQCETEVKPISRRFVSSPFEGILKSSLVQAGDSISEGAPLAMLDEDEIKLQLSSIEAEKEKYRKQKSTALANKETLAKQQAQLEYRRLSYKQDLLQQRMRNLQITSPISGVVLANELEDSEGAPVSQGQVLFEIAPLDRMTFCVYISQQDIAYVEPGMAVNVTVDSSRHSFSGKIKRIRPQATTFENESVFVAEVEFENAQSQIRPGMRGYASVVGKHQSIGWILFRKPYGFFKKLTGF